MTCRVQTGGRPNHVKFYPMLRLASDRDKTYTPRAMTNRELTDALGIFVAEYGVTSYTDIHNAFNSGKFIVVKREMTDTSYFTYYLRLRNSSGTYYFQTFGNSNTTNYYCYINSSGTWTVGSTYLAPLASPAFTGTPTAPTATSGTNTTQIATTAFVQDAVGSWTTAVSCAIGDTSVTISDSAITTTSNVKIWSETTSGKPLNYTTVVITTGQAVITFAKALTEVTSVKLQIVK